MNLPPIPQVRPANVLDLLWPWGRVRELWYIIQCLNTRVHLLQAREAELVRRIEAAAAQLEDVQ